MLGFEVSEYVCGAPAVARVLLWLGGATGGRAGRRRSASQLTVAIPEFAWAAGTAAKNNETAAINETFLVEYLITFLQMVDDLALGLLEGGRNAGHRKVCLD